MTKPKQIKYEIACYFIVNCGIVHWTVHVCYVHSILRRPIILDGEIIEEEASRSINPLIPISADIDGTTLFIEFTKVIGNVDITVKDDTKKEVYSSSVDVTAANQATSFSIADLAPGTYLLEFTNSNGGYVYGQFIVE